MTDFSISSPCLLDKFSSGLITSRRILIVDPDENLCADIRQIIGFDPTVKLVFVRDISRALFQLQEWNYSAHLILCDMRLSGGCLTLLSAVQYSQAAIPILIVSNEYDDQNVLDCLQCGAADYLEKPVSRLILRLVIYRNLERQRSLIPGDNQAMNFITAKLDFIDVKTPATYEFIERFLRFVTILRDSRLDPQERIDLRIAISEIGRNAVEWGNRQDRTKNLRLSYRRLSDRVVVRIEDEGAGFDHHLHCAPAFDPSVNAHSRRAVGKRLGGYGIYTARSLVDELRYNDIGNTATLTKFIIHNA